MRLIDGDALLETVEDHVTAVSCCPTVDWSRGKTQMKKQVIEDIRNAPTVGGWISVKDRLPEVGKVVLAFGTRSATTGMFQGVNTRNDLWWWKGHTIKHVSHWMPLPEPQKEGSK